MTKKIIVLAIASLFLMTGLALAEQGATAFGGKKYYEQQVFVDAYNYAAGSIAANAIVVFDTTNATLADSMGAFIGTSVTANDIMVFGVTDAIIPGQSAGRVCIRGPHLVNGLGGVGISAGTIVYQSATAGVATPVGASASYAPVGSVGIALSSTTSGSPFLTGGSNGPAFWIWVAPQRQR